MLVLLPATRETNGSGSWMPYSLWKRWKSGKIAAISGHASLDEVARYTKAADQARLARNAMTRTVPRTNNESKVSQSTGV